METRDIILELRTKNGMSQDALAEMKVSIVQINMQKSKSGDRMIVHLTIRCKNTSHYDSIVSKLRQLPCVLSVVRGYTN